MKIVILIISITFMQSAYAASLKFFDSEEGSKAQFTVINSKDIYKFEYDEDDSELRVRTTNNFLDFKVKTSDEADRIIIKLMDETNKSLVVLKKS